MENPFSFKVGQVMTGFGIGCGVGIGVGRPLNFGAIPVFQQVLSATRGATDAFSGVGRHMNGSLTRLGLKSFEAGIGCGVGIGHGFGVGIALKPGVVHDIQSYLGQAMEKMMKNLPGVPGLLDSQNIIPQSSQTNYLKTNAHREGNATQMESNTSGSKLQHPKEDSLLLKSPSEYSSISSLSDTSIGTRSEKIISGFIQNPVLQNQADLELNELAGRLQSERNFLQVLLRHQEIIEELAKENQNLRQILVEELKVSASKFHFSERATKVSSVCSDCFDCRRRQRKSPR
ncbi:hypothetical protein AMTRI_Chr03g52550 [Amborella trichopoda]|uniref:Uncharacterized protein n=1 Tax=Amborella trichopoda TaxID=13333 RepID=W1P0G2_AMBTC|nr:uncharacterized protein LOC18429191 [Amborella trichopoda]ERN01114.1 hypothetical protein AMTR_s00002p00201330 [Amborella trichopoda]|eukprot:XP_006838545.1 uncharacterized protein LOC18429191 [Amborella trichopoda]